MSTMQARKDLICGLPAFGIIPQLHQKPQQAGDAQAKRYLICGLTANRIKPQIHQQPPQEEDDEQGSDVEEITRVQFRRSMEYFTRVEVDEEYIEPEFRRLVQKLQNEEQRLRNQELINQEHNSAPMKRPKQEQGESSRGKGSSSRLRHGDY